MSYNPYFETGVVNRPSPCVQYSWLLLQLQTFFNRSSPLLCIEFKSAVIPPSRVQQNFCLLLVGVKFCFTCFMKRSTYSGSATRTCFLVKNLHLPIDLKTLNC